MADAENEQCGGGGEDVGRDEAEEVAVVVLRTDAHDKGDGKSEDAEDIDDAAETLEARGVFRLVKDRADIIGEYHAACKVDVYHAVEVDGEVGKMADELVAHDGQPGKGEVFEYGGIGGNQAQDGDGDVDPDNHAEIPEVAFLYAEGVKGAMEREAVEEGPEDKCTEDAEDIFGE